MSCPPRTSGATSLPTFDRDEADYGRITFLHTPALGDRVAKYDRLTGAAATEPPLPYGLTR